MQNMIYRSSRSQGRLTSMMALTALAALIVAAGCGGEEAEDPQGSTQRITCKTTADCKARGGQCQLNICVADNECKTAADCTSGEVCLPDKDFGGLCGIKGTAPAPGPAWSCKADTDCPKSQQCKAGKCVLPPKKPAVEVCDNGKDDDGDGFADCKDTDCEREPVCQKTTSPPKSCDVLKQNCTTTGYRCWPGGDHAKDGMCYPTGPMKDGDPCVEPPVNGPKSCGKGLVCAAVDSTGLPVCRKLCGTTADCAKTDACYKLSLGAGSSTVDYGVCALAPTPPPPPPPLPCNVFTQNCAASSMMCIPQEKKTNMCVGLGAGAAGAACMANNFCSPKLMCAELVGTSGASKYFGFGDVRGGTCLPLCDPAAPACPAGSTCSSILFGGVPRTDIGVCAS